MTVHEMAKIDTSRGVAANYKYRDRKLGEPVFDSLIVRGTVSLGVLLVIGACVIFGVSMKQQNEYSGAELSDYESLGAQACWIQSSYSYNVRTKRKSKLRADCIEEWEYNVVDMTTNKTFVSEVLQQKACAWACEDCWDYEGPDFYAGVKSNVPGIPLTNDTMLLQECYGPTVDVEDLSDYFECDEFEDNEDCIRLNDPREDLDDRMDSVGVGLLAAYVGLGGGAIVLIWGAYFYCKNRIVYQRDQVKLREIEANAADKGIREDDDDESGPHESKAGADVAADTKEEA